MEEAWRYFTEEITSGKLSRVSCPQTGTFVWSSLSHTQDPSFLSLSISPGTRPSQGNCCRDTSGAPLAILTLHNDTPTEMHNWMYESSKVSAKMSKVGYVKSDDQSLTTFSYRRNYLLPASTRLSISSGSLLQLS